MAEHDTDQDPARSPDTEVVPADVARAERRAAASRRADDVETAGPLSRRDRGRLRARRAGSGRPPYAALAGLVLFVVVAIFAPLLSPHDPIDLDMAHALQPPFWSKGGSSDHLLGTDKLGRDVFSRLLFGARPALIIAVTSVAIAAVVGSAIGIVAAFFGKVVDQVLMRVVDIMLAFPALLLALLLAARFGPGLRNVILVLSLVLWATYARQVRAAGLVVMKQEYVTLARSGGRGLGIMPRHVLPNVVNTVIVLATLQLGVAIIFEASLSFVGVSIPPPNPSWGGMINDGRGSIATSWWISVCPGLAILLLVLSVNVVGEWLETYLDPRRRDR